MSTIRQKIEIMEQAEAGKPVYSKITGLLDSQRYTWILDEHPRWNWESYEYKLDPEPAKFGKVTCDKCKFFDGYRHCNKNPYFTYHPDETKKVKEYVFEKNRFTNCKDFDEKFFLWLIKFVWKFLTSK